MQKKNVIIMGAAGRDFHNFNVFFRNNSNYNVVAFTATQIPDIDERKYPKELSGKLYPHGIPIHPESQLRELIKKFNADVVVLAYSDLNHTDVMHKASLVLAAGADFWLLGPNSTMINSKKPVIAVTAVRTGAGKSPTTRKIVDYLKGCQIVVIRHPMPYGNLVKQKCQRFAKLKDLDKEKCTIEEREEYEPLIKRGIIVYAGVDYEEIFRRAEREADIIIWDGGNNDFPFVKSDLHICIADPHRPGHEVSYYPGETNLRMASVIIINKIKTAKKEGIKLVEENIKKNNPGAIIVKASLSLTADKPNFIKGKNVLVVEDGPTLTHGQMKYGAGTLAAEKYKAKSIVDAQRHAVGSIKNVYKKYTHLKKILPAMGYSSKQIKELEQTINRSGCDSVIDASPVNLSTLMKITKPIVNVEYEFEEVGRPTLKEVLGKFVKKCGV